MQNFTLEMFVAFRMAYSCSFGKRGNLEFPNFLQNKFYNINNWSHKKLSKTFYFGQSGEILSNLVTMIM